MTAAAGEFADLGLSAAQAAELIRDTALQWTAAGFLAPLALEELLARGAADRTLVLDELVVDLRLHGVACRELDLVFGHLYANRDGARSRLSIVEHAGQLLFYVERRLVLASGPEGLVAHVKAILTDLYVDAVENGFLTHGALLQNGDCSLLLSAEPGAGKTTLALALAAVGWRYGSDDIVRLSPEGAARGVPFAAAVKSGGVSLLHGFWPELERLPEWERTDGQRARYLLPPQRAQTPQPLSVVVTLARRPGAAAEVKPISAVDALGAIVHSAYARRWCMTGDALCNLAATLERAVCVRLEYSDLGPAVQAIGELAGVQAEAA
ncbi:hypothetical protein LJR219_001036 [Phenylobacterium sp. LjRoot219]|uniref:hypothetical protein n=1 Tax=Phenylobacterium sp. LjRoot219 TaxID=3342283 RepID=UPI003ECD5458